jgi:LysM repeat protein/ribosomal protein L40E
MSEEPTVPVRDEEKRFCPECGARVAARATSCLMCGTSLDETERVEERPPSQPSRWVFWLAVVGASVAVLVVAGLLLRPFVLPAPATPTLTASPTRTPTVTRRSTPTATPTITPTPTPLPPRAHQVQDGETLLSIAEEYITTVEDILALNPGIAPELLQVGQVLLIPPAVPTAVLLPTVEPGAPTPTPSDYLVHVVAPGETLLSIAQRYGVTVALIRAANSEIPPGSDVIQVNQTLVIPLGTPMPTPTSTPDPGATPTPLPSYPPPPLLSPPDGAVFGGPDAVIVLQWASVDILRTSEWYEVRVTGPGAVSAVERPPTTAYRVPADFYALAGVTAREFRWQVSVVRRVRATDTYEVVSDPGPRRAFLWLDVLPSPGPTP